MKEYLVATKVAKFPEAHTGLLETSVQESTLYKNLQLQKAEAARKKARAERKNA